MTFQPDQTLVQEHRCWLAQFNPQYLANWRKLLASDPEAAACEAAVRRLLAENGNTVEPNEDLAGSKRAPDFRCRQADEQFFVEVTCVSISKASEQTGLQHPFDVESFSAFSGYSSLEDAIFNEARNKTPQCSNLGRPALLAVGTFHWQASYLCFDRKHIELFLTGRTCLTHDICAATGTPIGESYLSTDLWSAAFLSPGASRVVRCPISGILACGFGCNPPSIRLALHPKPVHAFNRSLLPKVECCRLKGGYENGVLRTEWK